MHICVTHAFLCHMFDLPLFENIANRCGVKMSHRSLMDVNGLEQFGGGGSEMESSAEKNFVMEFCHAHATLLWCLKRITQVS